MTLHERAGLGPVLVTGAGGFAGGHLASHLESRAVPVTRWTRADADLLDRAAVRAAVARLAPSTVFHCAGLPHVAQSFGDAAAPLATNVLGTHHLLDALRRAGRPCRVLVTGSAYVYAPSNSPLREEDALAPASPYALSKLAQEQLAIRSQREDGLEIIVARAFNHTGPRQDPSFVAPSIAQQIAAIERGECEPVIRVGNTSAVRDLSDVRDVVAAYAALMESGTPGEIYNVATGHGHAVSAVVEGLASRARVPVRIETDPSRFRPNDLPHLVGDPSKLRAATGWTPRVSFEQMLDDLLEYWRSA